jgi:molybdate transport system substrate-binding protein
MMRIFLFRTMVAAITLSLALAAAPVRADDSPVIAAAADLQFAIRDIAEAFKGETGEAVRLSMGSSGNFARQIRQGAPFQIYMSADEQYVLDLGRDGFTRDDGDLYAIGRIVVIVPHGSPLKADGTLEDLRAALTDGRVNRFAIANPDHAPYGVAAKQALTTQGLWESIQRTLVLGENVSQATQFATSANAQGGIIAYSLALSPQVSAMGEFELIPEGWHAPLRQRMVLLKNAGPVAERFYEYVQQPAARTIFRKYGFVLPGEES